MTDGLMSYVHGASDVPLIGEPIFTNLRRTATRFSDREALVVPHQGFRATYRELVEQCELVGRGLMERGVEKGDRVGIWSPNRSEWVVVQHEGHPQVRAAVAHLGQHRRVIALAEASRQEQHARP